MRACGLAIVKHAHDYGFLVWEAGVPRLLLAGDAVTLATIRPHWNTIQAVLRRAALFARQLFTPSVDPFVRFRDSQWITQGCPSCGADIAGHDLRCDLCTMAVALVLEGTP